MRSTIIIIAALLSSPLQAQGTTERQGEQGNEVAADPASEEECKKVPITCEHFTPVPSYLGSDGGGITAADNPEFGINLQQFEAPTFEQLQTESEAATGF